jgi:hypothetical protein
MIHFLLCVLMAFYLGMRVERALLCRRNGWGPGTVLIGDGDGFNHKIQITAIGQEAVLAKQITFFEGLEVVWELTFQDWKRMEDGAAEDRSLRRLTRERRIGTDHERQQTSSIRRRT